MHILEALGNFARSLGFSPTPSALPAQVDSALHTREERYLGRPNEGAFLSLSNRYFCNCFPSSHEHSFSLPPPLPSRPIVLKPSGFVPLLDFSHWVLAPDRKTPVTIFPGGGRGKERFNERYYKLFRGRDYE